MTVAVAPVQTVPMIKFWGDSEAVTRKKENLQMPKLAFSHRCLS